MRDFYRNTSYPGPVNIVEGETTTTRFSGLVADEEKLCDEIARRAINSRSHEWQLRTKITEQKPTINV